MGKGDRKTAKGKRIIGSYGVTRKRKKDQPSASPVNTASSAEKPAAKKTTAKKTTAKSGTAKATAEKKPAAKKTTTRKATGKEDTAE